MSAVARISDHGRRLRVATQFGIIFSTLRLYLDTRDVSSATLKSSAVCHHTTESSVGRRRSDRAGVRHLGGVKHEEGCWHAVDNDPIGSLGGELSVPLHLG